MATQTKRIEDYIPEKGDYYMENGAFYTYTGERWDVEEPDGYGRFAFDIVGAKYPHERKKNITDKNITDKLNFEDLKN